MGQELVAESSQLDDAVIRLENVSKLYKMYDRPMDVLTEAIFRRKKHQEFWALRNISCAVPRGGITGIVGRNGAGKSTLLKIVSGTLAQSSGVVDVNGSLAAILELGTGFHPEFTGRENVYLGGMCLGMTREQIDDRIDEIITFSGLDEFIDRPFKTYSSGMQSRLTFATATSVDPEILIVDEALSVGDARFQRRSFARMEEYRRRGKTILLVSHDTNTIAEFCDSVILLEAGEVQSVGDPKEVLLDYHQLLFSESHPVRLPVADDADLEPETAIQAAEETGSSGETNPCTALGRSGTLEIAGYQSEGYDPIERLKSVEVGDGRATIVDAALLNTDFQPVNTIKTGEQCHIWMRVQFREFVEEIVPGVLVRNAKGVDLFGWDTSWAGVEGPVGGKDGKVDIVMTIDNRLASGDYFLTCALADTASVKHDVRYDLLQFRVIGESSAYTTSIVDLGLEYQAWPSSA